MEEQILKMIKHDTSLVGWAKHDFEQKSKEISSHVMDFIDWIYESRYSKYWGSDEPNNHKWYMQNTMPDRKYYTTNELYNYWLKEVKQ